jgi:hypothetical protein
VPYAKRAETRAYTYPVPAVKLKGGNIYTSSVAFQRQKPIETEEKQRKAAFLILKFMQDRIAARNLSFYTILIYF